MSFIIGNKCVDCLDTSCVSVCPIDCIHGPIYTDRMGWEVSQMSDEDKKGKQLYINPSECINCGACVPAGSYTHLTLPTILRLVKSRAASDPTKSLTQKFLYEPVR